jgi:hypothetical protein
MRCVSLQILLNLRSRAFRFIYLVVLHRNSRRTSAFLHRESRPKNSRMKLLYFFFFNVCWPKTHGPAVAWAFPRCTTCHAHCLCYIHTPVQWIKNGQTVGHTVPRCCADRRVRENGMRSAIMDESWFAKWGKEKRKRKKKKKTYPLNTMPPSLLA